MAPRRSAMFSQAWTLATKSMNIAIFQQTRATLYTAVLLPILVAVYLGVGQRLNQPQADFGIAEPRAIRSLSNALDTAGRGGETVCFVNGGFTDGEIDRVIGDLSETVRAAGKNASTVETAQDVGYVCTSSVRGQSNCLGAVVFHSSPDEGDGGVWNYTILADASLGREFNFGDDDNDAQVYVLPLQRAVDNAIVRANGSSSS